LPTLVSTMPKKKRKSLLQRPRKRRERKRSLFVTRERLKEEKEDDSPSVGKKRPRNSRKKGEGKVPHKKKADDLNPKKKSEADLLYYRIQEDDLEGSRELVLSTRRGGEKKKGEKVDMEMFKENCSLKHRRKETRTGLPFKERGEEKRRDSASEETRKSTTEIFLNWGKKDLNSSARERGKGGGKREDTARSRKARVHISQAGRGGGWEKGGLFFRVKKKEGGEERRGSAVQNKKTHVF